MGVSRQALRTQSGWIRTKRTESSISTLPNWSLSKILIVANNICTSLSEDSANESKRGSSELTHDHIYHDSYFKIAALHKEDREISWDSVSDVSP